MTQPALERRLYKQEEDVDHINVVEKIRFLTPDVAVSQAVRVSGGMIRGLLESVAAPDHVAGRVPA